MDNNDNTHSSIQWNADCKNEQLIYNELFKERLKQFIDTKDKHALLVISDYDYTITKRRNEDNDEVFHCTYQFFDKSPIMPEDFKKASRALFDKNDKYDNDPNISIEEREKYLQKYYEDDLTLIANLGLIKDQMNENCEVVFKDKRFFFRKGAKDFFTLLQQKQIPLIFASGGIKEIIQATLRKLLGNEYNKDKLIDIISNEFTYDKNTKQSIGIVKPLIYTLNKKEFIGKIVLSKFDLAKTNVIFIGDNINDIDCLDNLNCPNLLSIAFSNGKTIYDAYYKKYDMIIANEGNFTHVNDIIKQLI